MFIKIIPIPKVMTITGLKITFKIGLMKTLIIVKIAVTFKTRRRRRNFKPVN